MVEVGTPELGADRGGQEVDVEVEGGVVVLDILVLAVTLRLSGEETRVVAAAVVKLDTEGSLWDNTDVVVGIFFKLPSSPDLLLLLLLLEATVFSILAIRRGTTVPSEVRTGLLLYLSPDEELHTTATAGEEVGGVFSLSPFVGPWLSET